MLGRFRYEGLKSVSERLVDGAVPLPGQLLSQLEGSRA